jgi:hypothetical protein
VVGVEVGDEDAVHSPHVPRRDRSGAPPDMEEPIAQERVGEQAHAVHLDQCRGVAEPGDGQAASASEIRIHGCVARGQLNSRLINSVRSMLAM